MLKGSKKIGYGMILVSVLLAAPVFSQTSDVVQQLSASSMVRFGCNDKERKICKSTVTGFCESVYVASAKATPDCKAVSTDNIAHVCGSADAKLFSTNMQCISPKKDAFCPHNLKDIKADDMERLYSCLDLHKDLCKQVCGARYDTIDVRNFFQTGRSPGILCQDTSLDEEKNGVNIKQDESRAKCMETHQGMYNWCTNYNRTLHGIELGAYVQCQGLISTPTPRPSVATDVR